MPKASFVAGFVHVPLHTKHTERLIASICLKCFTRIAVSTRPENLEIVERIHVCELLERRLRG
jgi:hypothetical protein